MMKIKYFLKFLALVNLAALATSIGPLYSLTDSSVYGPWKGEYSEYYCYAFALNRTELPSEFETEFSIPTR